MISTLTTSRGTFQIKGFIAKLFYHTYHFTAPVGIGFGIYGLIMGLYRQNEFVVLAGLIALTSALSLRLFITLIFERNGKPIKSRKEIILPAKITVKHK